MRVEIRITRLHRIKNIGKITLYFFEDENPPQICWVPKAPHTEKRKWIMARSNALYDLYIFILLIIRTELYLYQESTSGFFCLACCYSLSARIVAQADSDARFSK